MSEDGANGTQQAAAAPESPDVIGALVEQVLYALGPKAGATMTYEGVHNALTGLLGQLEEVVPHLFGNLHGEGAASRPYWGLIARDRNGEQQLLLTPKDASSLSTLQEKLFFATVLAFAHEPGVLTWLGLMGVHVQFIEQTTMPSAAPKLII